MLARFAFGFLVWLGATARAHYLGEDVGQVPLLAPGTIAAASCD